jgi:hypothetical protein
MPHIAGHDRSQTLLLPEALEAYVVPDNLFIVAHARAEKDQLRQQGSVWDLSDPVAVHAQ